MYGDVVILLVLCWAIKKKASHKLSGKIGEKDMQPSNRNKREEKRAIIFTMKPIITEAHTHYAHVLSLPLCIHIIKNFTRIPNFQVIHVENVIATNNNYMKYFNFFNKIANFSVITCAPQPLVMPNLYFVSCHPQQITNSLMSCGVDSIRHAYT